MYQYRDHLDNIRLSYTEDPSNPGQPTIIEENNYYPFGGRHQGYNNGGDTALGNDLAQMWKFGGKELDESLGLETYDFGARNYDPWIGRWMNIDPLAEQMRRHSTYNFAFNNPIGFIDPDGMAPFSTLVTENEDGTHTVVGGDANDGDNNIYIASKNENGEYASTGESIGESLTSHSFFDDSENAVVGAVIDVNSTEGQNFIDNEIIEDKPFITDYMANATRGEKYDLKERGMKEALAEGKTKLQHRYRGSRASNGKIGSARDFGNGAAGIVAGRFGLSWNAARLAFDALETAQHSSIFNVGLPGGGTGIIFNINFTSEKTPTQKAQKLGHSIGIKLNKQDGKINF